MAAEAALSYAVQTLGNILVEKVKFLRGVKGEVLRLKDELKRMQSFLKDAAEKQVNDERVRNWISEIRELALDSQDAIEMFVLNAQKAGRSRLGLPEKFACFPSHVYRIFKVGEEIESIQKRIQDLDSSLQRYGILQEEEADSSSGRRREDDERRRRLAHWEDDKHVVGLDEDEELLLHKAILKKADEGLCISTIVGIGGIGKSTLARKIYNRAADGFECRAWVVVSREFTPEDIIRQIIMQLRISPQPKVESINDKLRRQEILQLTLYNHLVDKRYFIVLDDVWEPTHWESLKTAFPHQQDEASRLLITSRNNVIINNANYVHEMKCLGPKDSWNLLLKKALIGSSNGKCPDELEQIGIEIVERCGGLPLAIIVVGGLLLEQKESISGWTKVLKGIDSHLGRAGGRVQAVLQLSYQNLAPQLKSCFLFLSLFKEDDSIPAKKLVHVWIALDLVQQEDVGNEETMEDVAGGYLHELINRNLLQIEGTTKDGRVKTCRIHDLLRELSIEKAKEEIKFEILKEEATSHSSRHPRHCAAYCSKKNFVDSITNTSKHLRSLFVHSDWKVDDPKSYSYFKSCKLLRVLDAGKSFGDQKWPRAIGGLVGLRYLGKVTDHYPSRRLSRSLSKLENLQVLHFPKGEIKVPDSMWKRENLRHLKLWVGILPNPHVKIQMLKNLQTLGYLRLKDPFIEQLTKMPGLRKLGLDIENISDSGRLFTTLGKLENLIRLHLKGFYCLNMDGLSTLHRITQLKLCHYFRRSPANFPPNLSYLTLRQTEFKEDLMPKLEKLPNLLYLKLCFDAYIGEVMEISHGGFQKLKQLRFYYLNKLRSIKVGEGAMPQLQRWEIKDCRYLKVENVNLSEHLRSKICYLSGGYLSGHN